jgi:hypothetical protein
MVSGTICPEMVALLLAGFMSVPARPTPTPTPLSATEKLTIVAPPFENAIPAAPSERSLSGPELARVTGAVLSDPLRAAQNLPGVAASDDFHASFEVRGASFDTVGVYVDGVLTPAIFHTAQDVNEGNNYSLTILSGEVVESIALVPSAAPVRYGDRTGAVLALETREGGRERIGLRGSLSVTGASLTADGPAGARLTWIASVRKSYADYLLERLQDEPTTIVGFYDAFAKVVWRPRAAHRVSLLGIHGRARWHESDPGSSVTALVTARAAADIAIGRWQWNPSSRAVISSTGWLMHARGTNTNRTDEQLYDGDLGEAGGRIDLAGTVGARHRLEAGIAARRILDRAQDMRFDTRASAFQTAYDFKPQSWQPSAYLQGTLASRSGRWELAGGGRFDRLGITDDDVWQPRASGFWRVLSRTRLLAGLGRYAQFPTFFDLFGPHANPNLRAATSMHYVGGIEQRLGERVRLRLEGYALRHASVPFTADAEYRLVAGKVQAPLTQAPLENSLSGRSRGFEVSVERHAGTGAYGWVAYAYGRARWDDAASGISFPTDADQRHTVAVYGALPLRRAVILSVRGRYGSGLPIPGFLEQRATGTFVSAERNLLRVPEYSRIDLRAEKTFVFSRVRVTAQAELVNALDHQQYRYESPSITARTGAARLRRDALIPRLPVIGFTVEY